MDANEIVVQRPTAGRPKLRRVATNLFVMVMIALMLVDSLPTTTALHGLLKEKSDPLLDVLGIWQGPWSLFAPVPDKQNQWISAEVTFVDGRRENWESIDWPKTSLADRFLKFRHMEYYDTVRGDENEAAWPDLADYLVRQIRSQRGINAEPARVVLTRHVITCLPPDDGELPARDDLWGTPHSEPFYTRTYQP